MKKTCIKKVLGIGSGCADLTLPDETTLPMGDEKDDGEDSAVSVGGNATVACFTLVKLGKNSGVEVDMILPISDDLFGEFIFKKAVEAGISIHSRKVTRTPFSLVFPNAGKRAVKRFRKFKYLSTSFPMLDVSDYAAIHFDGHQPNAALHYAKLAREKGVLTSFDGGSYEREGVDELLNYMDIAVVCERFCEHLGKSPEETLTFLLAKGAKLAAVTSGKEDILYQEAGQSAPSVLPSVPVDDNMVEDSTGAGDIFHGAYLCSWLTNPKGSWRKHLAFASSASSLAIQKRGTHTSIPELEDVLRVYNENY